MSLAEKVLAEEVKLEEKVVPEIEFYFDRPERLNTEQ